MLPVIDRLDRPGPTTSSTLSKIDPYLELDWIDRAYQGSRLGALTEDDLEGLAPLDEYQRDTRRVKPGGRQRSGTSQLDAKIAKQLEREQRGDYSSHPAAARARLAR